MKLHGRGVGIALDQTWLVRDTLAPTSQRQLDCIQAKRNLEPEFGRDFNTVSIMRP